ncbi:MAG TPA: hypothetical protein VN328_06270, partial [Thermodesulfovibrionales bacterium]|nr:hypothetical protein [Thermodesulfovibrionales bacterium]
YRYRVRATTSSSPTSWTLLQDPADTTPYYSLLPGVYTRTYPSAPTSPTLVVNGTEQITAGWAGVYGEVGYQLKYALRPGGIGGICPTTGGGGWTAVNPQPNENVVSRAVGLICQGGGDSGKTCTDDSQCPGGTCPKLTQGTFYCFEVRACRAYGSGTLYYNEKQCAGGPYNGWACNFDSDCLGSPCQYTGVGNCKGAGCGNGCSDVNGYGPWLFIGAKQTALPAPVLTLSNTAPQLDDPTTQMYLTWTQITGNNGYTVVRHTKSVCNTAASQRTACTKDEDCVSFGVACLGGTTIEQPKDQTYYKDTGLTSGEVYYYKIYSKNDESTKSVPNEAYKRTRSIKPTVSLTVLSPSQVSLTWPVVYGANRYRIQRKQMPTPGTYSEIAAEVGLCSNNPPKACTNATQTADCGAGNTCTGTNSEGICSNTVTQECTVAGDASCGMGRCFGPYQQMYCNQVNPFAGCTTLVPVVTTYTNSSGLSDGSNYCYQVAAYNSSTNPDSWSASSADSAWSDQVCVWTSDIAKPTLNCGNCTGCPGSCVTTNSLRVQVTWSYNPTTGCPTTCRATIDGVEIEVKMPSGPWVTAATTNTSPLDHTIALSPDTQYNYRARAFKCKDAGENDCTCGSGGSCVKKYSEYSDVLGIKTRAYTAGDTTCY